jgi:hypothetical protein
MKSFPAKKTKEVMGTDYGVLAKTLIEIKGKRLFIHRPVTDAGHAFKVAGTMELHRCGPVRTVSTQSIEAP